MKDAAARLMAMLSLAAVLSCKREEFKLIYEPLDRTDVVGCYSLGETINFKIDEGLIVFNGGDLESSYEYGKAAKTNDETLLLDRRIFLDWSRSKPSEDVILFSDFGKDQQSSAAYGVFRKPGRTSIEVSYYDNEGLEVFTRVSCDLVKE